MTNKHNFAGYIEHRDIQYFCTVNDYVVKMLHKSEPETRSFRIVDEEEEKYLFGFSENDCIFAVFKPQGINYDSFSSHVPYHFNTPIFIKARTSETNDISYFDGIEFYGETVNKIFNPRQAEKHSKLNEDMNIAFLSHSDYSKVFDIEIDKQKAKIELLVYRHIHLAEQKNEDGTISLGSVNSAICIKFENPKSLEVLVRYWQMFNELLIFLTGRRNVEFGVKILHKNESNSFLHIADGFFRRANSDIYNDRIDKTIQINALNDKFPELFMLFADKKTSPFLLFLPESNKKVNRISYTDILDICTSFEKEFELSKLKIQSNDMADMLYKSLKDAIKELRKTQVGNDEREDKIFDVAYSSIKHITSSLADKIYLLYERSLINPDDIPIEKSSDIRNSINNFVKLRNSITHTGVVNWGDSGLFSRTLLKILYVNILLRAGVDKETAVKITERKWGT